jgi:murein L,D-transpeptidase YafK
MAASAALGLLAVLDRQIPGIVADTLPTAEVVVVEKAAARLSLLRDGRSYRTYPVSLGPSPLGHKQRQGDGRTPEGRYVIDERYDDNQYYKALRISYPNPEDRRLAMARGDDPGGMIMIHGQPNGMGWLGWLTRYFDWTNGSIAVGSVAMEEIWRAVVDGTPIEVRP